MVELSPEAVTDRMRRVFFLLVGVAVVSVTLLAQTPTSFEVASVKPRNSGANSSSVDTQPNGRLVFTIHRAAHGD